MDNQGTRSRSFASIDDNEMDLDPLPAAPAGSPNSYHCTTYLACTSIDSLMDVCGQETTLAVDHSYVQTGFEKKLIRRFKAKNGKKRSLCKKAAIYKSRSGRENQRQKKPSRRGAMLRYSNRVDSRIVKGRSKRSRMRRLLDKPSKSTFQYLQNISDQSFGLRERCLSQFNTPIQRKDNVSSLGARNMELLNGKTTSVESHDCEDDPNHDTNMEGFHWEGVQRPSVAVGVDGYNSNAEIQGDGNGILVPEDLAASFATLGIRG
ncbi:hypothetical protein MFRU_003g01800 [Monilinia fructicola]|nr:hypothetical protein MFRU_003g01800 [Monilinia fructicola]